MSISHSVIYLKSAAASFDLSWKFTTFRAPCGADFYWIPIILISGLIYDLVMTFDSPGPTNVVKLVRFSSLKIDF